MRRALAVATAGAAALAAAPSALAQATLAPAPDGDPAILNLPAHSTGPAWSGRGKVARVDLRKLRQAALAALLACSLASAWAQVAAQTKPANAATGPQAATLDFGLGRPAIAKELAAWDIDVRPDFKGPPMGLGSVSQGQVVWESRCASSQGVFGESNEVFSPLVGGTAADDVKNGHVAGLNDRGFPGRTTLMKVACLADKIKACGMGTWGQVPMPAQALSEDDAKLIAAWLAGGARP